MCKTMFLHFVPVDGVDQEFLGGKGMFLCFYVSRKQACGHGLNSHSTATTTNPATSPPLPRHRFHHRHVRQQNKKAQAIWARVGQVLTAENTPPKVSAKFYKAVVQSVHLYGSKTWNLTTTALAQLEGFQTCAAYRMAEKHKPKKGPHHKWVYPQSSDALQKCGMATILHYIDVRRATIFQYVVDWPIYEECREGEQGGDCHRNSGGGNRR
jgi:hypothetical protein